MKPESLGQNVIPAKGNLAPALVIQLNSIFVESLIKLVTSEFPPPLLSQYGINTKSSLFMTISLFLFKEIDGTIIIPRIK